MEIYDLMYTPNYTHITLRYELPRSSYMQHTTSVQGKNLWVDGVRWEKAKKDRDQDEMRQHACVTDDAIESNARGDQTRLELG